MNHSTLVVAISPVSCICAFSISRKINKGRTQERDSTNTLAVLSGMLAALAIVIPLGATLLPEKQFPWQAWLLIGALFAGLSSMFGTIYSMIGLQATARFVPANPPYVPCWINTTWIALAFIAFSCIAVRAMPADEDRTFSRNTAGARFLVERALPNLGVSEHDLETEWGSPGDKNNLGLLYHTNTGSTIFCLDSHQIIKSIIEVRESDTNALQTYCK